MEIWIWSSGHRNGSGFIAFRIGSKNLENVGLPQDPNLLKSKRFGIKVEYLIYLSAILFIVNMVFIQGFRRFRNNS